MPKEKKVNEEAIEEIKEESVAAETPAADEPAKKAAKEATDETIEEATEAPKSQEPEAIETDSVDAGVETFEDCPTEQGDDTVTVQQVRFASFEDVSTAKGEENKNLDLLMDIKLQLTVELGRTELPIKKVLELTRGSIIELEKVAGEPVELYANGKLVAHGEVVVIEDNFGLRITSITDPEDRIKGG